MERKGGRAGGKAETAGEAIPSMRKEDGRNNTKKGYTPHPLPTQKKNQKTFLSPCKDYIKS